jgi:hypothetical protein
MVGIFQGCRGGAVSSRHYKTVMSLADHTGSTICESIDHFPAFELDDLSYILEVSRCFPCGEPYHLSNRCQGFWRSSA